jgi:hypothetical protein
MPATPIIRIENAPLSPAAISKWNSFLAECPDGNFFQSPVMMALYHGCENYRPVAILAENGQGTLLGVLVAVIISDRIWGIPFRRILVLGGPVICGTAEERKAVGSALLAALLQQVSRKTVFVEVRNLHPPEDRMSAFSTAGFTWHDHLNSLLPAESREEVFAGFKPSKQRQILRGIENGALIAPAVSEGEVESLYRLLQDLYRKKVRKPLPPQDFFRNFYREVQGQGLGVILVVKHHGEVIGGMVCPFSGRDTLHEWYIASVRDELQHLYPGVLATWAGIEYAVSHNFSRFDFMGMGIPRKQYGIRDFKAQFGGRIVNYGRWQMVNNRLLYLAGLAGYNLLTLGKKGRG